MARGQAGAERGKSFRTKTLRLHPHEIQLIDQACAALNGMERTQLMQEGALAEAARLGITFAAEGPAPRLTTSWPYMPERGQEPTEIRISITLSLPIAELIARAAQAIHASEPMFVIGSTLAYIGRLKASFTANAADSPEEAEELLARLARIELPPLYELAPVRARRRSSAGALAKTGQRSPRTRR